MIVAGSKMRRSAERNVSSRRVVWYLSRGINIVASHNGCAGMVPGRVPDIYAVGLGDVCSSNAVRGRLVRLVDSGGVSVVQ